ncbi:MAG: oligoendopeptidase F family protein [Bacilli bacterium]|nr:oligoendopeptidase F family protein [Bacilli bacterium]MDD3895588.1 oligoendopeptidase F family protein [Bacilli bacterium]MDD4407840.1 oligoendopeptidase F family protein [Bacilli bacterium]
MNYQNRNEIEEKYKWDLTKRYKNDEAWEKDFNEVKKLLNNILIYKNKVLECEKNLFAALEIKFETKCNLEKLYCYANCKHDEDVENNKYALMLNKIISLSYEFSEKEAYLTPEILKGSKTLLKKYIGSDILKKYKFYLTNLLREKEHYLNEKEEQIVSKLTSTRSVYENISNVLTNSVIDYGKVTVDGHKIELLNSNYRQIVTNQNRKTRKEAFLKLTTNLKKYENIYGMNLIASMKQAKSLSEIYKYKSVLEMDLFLSNIPDKVVSNLYEVIEKRLDVYQDYFKMIKKNLKLKELEYYDKEAQLISTDQKFSIEETKAILLKSLEVLGQDYTKLLKKAFDDRWIDFGCYKGKTSLIYSICNYGDNPLVLTNYLGEFKDISTLAHELGHALHSYLSMERTYHEFYHDILTAEVASLTNEILFSNYIINNSNDKDLKLTAIYNILHIIQNNLYDACLEGKLENEVYDLLEKGNEVNTAMLNEMIYKFRKEYYGDLVKINDNVSLMWIRRMHYFRPYYLFKYATGISSAIYISKKILNNEDNIKEKYLAFLKKGGSNYPTELLLEMGVDLTKPEVINEAINYMDYLIDEFNKISEE